jgi:heme exporter protein D
MQWNSAAEFFDMGGYAVYVWGSFGMTFAVMLLEMWLIHRRRVQTLAMLKQELHGEQAP